MSDSGRENLLQELYELDLVGADGIRLGTFASPAFESDGGLNLDAWRPDGPLDELCALWIDRAPRFGAVAAHFPKLAGRFVASFWAPEVFFAWGYGVLPWYGSVGKRPGLDKYTAGQVTAARGPARFWSPELPEVIVLRGSDVPDGVYALDATGRRWATWHRALAFLLLLCLALPVRVL